MPRHEWTTERGIEMVYLPAGEFKMGSEKGADDEKPVHLVKLSPYSIGKYPVTVGQYQAYCEDTSVKMPDLPAWSKLDHPMVDVTWHDAERYCAWAGGSLPSEAEWEYACRGGTDTEYWWGDKFDSSKLRCSTEVWGDSGGTSAVGKYPANGFGLYDTLGNVWEWCSDWYDEHFYKNSPTEHPQGADSGTTRVLRGGSWGNCGHGNFRCAYRNGNDVDIRGNNLGFRVVFRELR